MIDLNTLQDNITELRFGDLRISKGTSRNPNAFVVSRISAGPNGGWDHYDVTTTKQFLVAGVDNTSIFGISDDPEKDFSTRHGMSLEEALAVVKRFQS